MANHARDPCRGHDVEMQYDYPTSGTRRDDYGPPRMSDTRPEDDQLHPGYQSNGRAPPYETYPHRDYGRDDDQYATAPPHEPRTYRESDRDDEHYARAPIPPKHEDSARDLSPAEPSNALTPYDEEKAYAEWHRGQAERDAAYDDRHIHKYDRRGPPPDDYHRRRNERRPRDDYSHGDDLRAPPDDYDRRGDRHAQMYDDQRLPPPSRRPHDYNDRALDKPKPEKEKDLAGTLIGGGAGALLGHELIGKGPLGTIGGAVVGAIAAKGMENYEEKKRREKDDERRRIRREHDSESYDPRGSYRSSNFYDTESTGPASATYDNRYPPRRTVRGGPRRHRMKSNSSSDSFTSDD